MQCTTTLLFLTGESTVTVETSTIVADDTTTPEGTSTTEDTSTTDGAGIAYLSGFTLASLCVMTMKL